MPNRIIKDSIHTSEKLNALTDFQFRLWVGLLTYVDDYGRGDARPAVVKGLVFPLRDRVSIKDVSDALGTLAGIGCVNLYEVDGRPYLCFPTWEVHQNIRAKKSKYPAPEDGKTQPEIICKQMQADDSKCPRNPIQSESNTNPNTNTNTAASALSSVMTAYMDKINPTPSQGSMDELKGYIETMGDAVCLKAIDIAMDERKTSWAYIRGILRNWKGRGVKCLADIEALDAEHEKQKPIRQQKSMVPGKDFNPKADRIQKSGDWMDEFLAGQGVQL